MKDVLVCQSCSMPIEQEEIIGTNADGSKNSDYCVYCYKDGKFTDNIDTLEEYTEYSLQFAEQAGMTKEQMKEHCEKILPTLKRWKKD
jgi:hypothetical protein